LSLLQPARSRPRRRVRRQRRGVARTVR